MIIPGPKPKPTALRAIEGTKARYPNRQEPKPARTNKPAPPDWLSDTAKTYWARVVVILENLNMLTEADLPLLERYCDFLADWKACRDFLQNAGQIYYPIKETVRLWNPETQQMETSERIKYLAEFPHVSKKLRISEHLLRIEQHFGMTPSARTRIMLDPSADIWGEDPFAVKRKA